MAHPSGYSRTQIILHWVIAVLILFQFLFHDAMETAFQAIEDGTAEPGGLHPHAVFGTIVLGLALWRLILRRRRGAPALPEGGNPIQDFIATWTHRVLYALLFLIPITGGMAWNGGLLIAAEVHGMLFFLALALIVLHIVGAIYHQYVLKDGLIRRMMKAE